MGRIRTKNIKNLTFALIEAYPDKFSGDFEKNKVALDELKIVPDKSVRNKVAGYLARKRKQSAKPLKEPSS